MFRKFILSATIACAVMMTIASTCFAYVGVVDHGILHGSDGGGGYDKAWVEYEADANHSYIVEVYVNKNGTHYGNKTTTVLAGNTSTCYSYKVYGHGGVEGWYVYIR